MSWQEKVEWRMHWDACNERRGAHYIKRGGMCCVWVTDTHGEGNWKREWSASRTYHYTWSTHAMRWTDLTMAFSTLQLPQQGCESNENYFSLSGLSLSSFISSLWSLNSRALKGLKVLYERREILKSNSRDWRDLDQHIISTLVT